MKVITNPLTIDAATPATFSRAGTAWYFDYAGVLQPAATNVLRFNWDYETAAFEGCLVEPAATNLFINNATVGSRTITVANAKTYTLSFFGAASGLATTLTLSGAATGTLTSAGAKKRVTLTIFTTGTTLTITSSGPGVGVHGQLELGGAATSVIPTGGAAVSRPADVIAGTGVFYNGFTDATQTYPAGSPYAIGEVVQYGGRLYESLVAQTPGPTPGTDPAAWLDTGPSNNTAWADRRSSTRSVGNDLEEAVCIFSATAFNAVGVMNMANCNYVHAALRWSMYAPPATLYKDGSPRNTLLVSASTGFYLTVVVNNNVMGPPTPPNPQIGEIVLGTIRDMGDAEYGASWSLVDYSKVDEGAWGDTTFTRGKNTKLHNVQVKVDNADYNWVCDLIADLTATPTVWQLSDAATYERGTLVYGFMKAARMGIPGATSTTLGLDIQGLT